MKTGYKNHEKLLIYCSIITQGRSRNKRKEKKIYRFLSKNKNKTSSSSSWLSYSWTSLTIMKKYILFKLSLDTEKKPKKKNEKIPKK